MGAGLDGEVASQLDRGAATLAETLRRPARPRTWLAEEALDPRRRSTLLAGRGFDRMLTTEPLLTPIPDQKITLTRPFVLDGRAHAVQAVAADAGLAAHFDGRATRPCAAHLLADLAVIYLDRPATTSAGGGRHRPPDWRPTRQFLDVVAAGLAGRPSSRPSPSTPSSRAVPTATRRGASLVRRPAIDPGGSLAEVADRPRATPGPTSTRSARCSDPTTPCRATSRSSCWWPSRPT